MITIKRPVGYLLCGALLMALSGVCAEEGTTDWQAKCRELEEKVQMLEEELDGHNLKAEALLSLYNEASLPRFCPRFNVKNIVELDFRQASLPDVVSELNRHLQSTGTNDIERAIGVRQKRIQELASEIEKLCEASKRAPLREVRLALPEGMAGNAITFSALGIRLSEALDYATDIAGVTYQVENDIAWIVPRRHILIPHEELNVESIRPRLDSALEPSVLLFRFTADGLKKALEEGLVEEMLQETMDSAFFTADPQPKKEIVHYLSAPGMQRFGYLVGAREGAENLRLSELIVTTMVSDVRLLRATVDTNIFRLVFSDYESNEPVQVEAAAIEIDDSIDDGFLTLDAGWRDLQPESGWREVQTKRRWKYPQPESGIYVYYRVGTQPIRPEDKDFFHELNQYRLGRIIEYPFGYLLRLPSP